MSRKYEISNNHLETKGGIARLERDGFTKTEIMQAAHRLTDCAEFSHRTRTDQREMIQNLFDRSQE